MSLCTQELLFDREMFSKDTILSACYEHAALATYDVTYKGNEVSVVIWVDGTEKQLSDCCHCLKRSVIDHQLRQKILEQTRQIKELLIKAALKEAGVSLGEERAYSAFQ